MKENEVIIERRKIFFLKKRRKTDEENFCTKKIFFGGEGEQRRKMRKYIMEKEKLSRTDGWRDIKIRRFYKWYSRTLEENSNFFS